MYKLRILSLGAGVQSTILFLMACDGIIPKFDCAIFADTGWEAKHTYDLLKQLKEIGRRAGIEIKTVRAGDVREPLYQSSGNKFIASMPLHLLDKNNGRKGMCRRQCTREFKTSPIVKEVRAMLGLKKYQRSEKDCVEQVIGFSMDETRRMMIARERFSVFSFPLITDLKMDREDCERWLFLNYPHLTVKRSACIGCPYKTNEEWNALKQRPIEWKQAIEYDRSVRIEENRYMVGYLHKSRVPLEDADLTIIEPPKQLSLFESCKEYRGIEIIKEMVDTL